MTISIATPKKPANTNPQDIEQTDHLRAAWNEGITSGDAGPLDFAELKAAARLNFER